MFYVLNTKRVLIFAGVVFLTILVIALLNIFIIPVVSVNGENNKQLPIYKVVTDENKVAITFDCAWGADDIPKILNTLEQYGAKATFFVVGSWVEKNPSMVKKVSDAGHEIANHTDTHPHIDKISEQDMTKELRDCSQKVKAITGKETTLLRGPYGEYNEIFMRVAKDMGMSVIQWSIDSLDWKGLNGEQMWDRMKDKLSCGDIILMHNDTDYTADALPSILENIKQRGYKMVTVSDLIYKDGYIINQAGQQVKK